MKRPSALLIFMCCSLSLPFTAREITASGTKIDSQETRIPSPQKVSPEAQSTPTIAIISPASATSMFSRSLECILTIRPTRILLEVLELVTWSPFDSLPW